MLRPGTTEPLTLAALPRIATEVANGLSSYWLDCVDCPASAPDDECARRVHYDPTGFNLPPDVDGETYLRTTVDGRGRRTRGDEHRCDVLPRRRARRSPHARRRGAGRRRPRPRPRAAARHPVRHRLRLSRPGLDRRRLARRRGHRDRARRARPDPGGDRPGGVHDWYLVDVPIDGSEPTILEGPERGPHWDHYWAWSVSNDGATQREP